MEEDQFKSNYITAKIYFDGLNQDLKDTLLNFELNCDINMMKCVMNGNRIFAKMKLKDSYPRYACMGNYYTIMDLENGGVDKNRQTHIRHNVYRSIAAYNLDCDYKTKVKILAKNSRCYGANLQDVLDICDHKLKQYEELLQSNSTDAQIKDYINR